MASLTVFRGHVQGVGFRYQAYRTARARRVQGWVRNCVDGSVELFLQGDAQEVRAVIDEVTERMRYHIITAETREVAEELGCVTFEIRM